jgi:protein-S-isoprenylcysteine O-methyltransferase Ste14
MTDQSSRVGQHGQEKLAGAIGPRIVLQFLIYVVLLPLVLFIAAGRWNWQAGWIFFGVHVFFTILSRVIPMIKNPELLVERARYAEVEGTSRGSRLMTLIVGLLGPLVLWVIAGLDERFGWSPPVPAAVQGVMLAALVVGYGLGTWAMAVNAFFSAVVRVQEERGQQVVDAGPYRVIRHPAYLGGMLVGPGMAIFLGSYWALIPALLTWIALIMRTRAEDAMLMQNLAGYAQYAQRVRYRLFPGIW